MVLSQSKKLSTLFFALIVFLPSVAHAVCSNPAGTEGQMIYNIDYKVIQYCNDTDWIAAMDRKAFGSGTCTNPVREEGAIIYNEAENVPQVCIGEWIALGPLNASAGTGGCSTPTRTEGTVIYNQTDKVMQYCDGSQYVRLQGAPPVDACAGFTTPGDICPDGSMYAGGAPIGNVRLYTTRCDIGQTWDGSSCTGTATQLSWNNGANTGYVDLVGAGSLENGLVNHNIMIATDSDSGAIGKQPHQAAQACEDLVINGHNDWFLPTYDELILVMSDRPTFNIDTLTYWISSEWDDNDARMIDSTPSNSNRQRKEVSNIVRCMRR